MNSFVMIVLLGTITALFAPHARADFVSDLADCKKILDADQRLICLDKATENLPPTDAAKRAKTVDKKSPIVIDPSQEKTSDAAKSKKSDEDTNETARRMYRARLDHVFLESGINMEVSIVNPNSEHAEGWTFEKPALMLFGYWDRPGIYKFVNTTKILEQAKSVHFKTVVFYSRGQGGMYRFNLTKSGQICDRDLCF
jgi:hypothetical protein